jgi:predicted metal-dependent hydrolase
MQSDVATRSPAVPRPRSPGLSFTVAGGLPDLDRSGFERSPGSIEDGVPRHWFGGNVVATQVANGVNLLFPAGERFFVRSVMRYLDRVSDPLLRARAKGFFGQEGRHAREHERVFEMMEAQGYDVRRFLRLYEAVAYGVIERVAPRALALSTTAACEHYTAILAEHALRHRLLDQAHPAMRALLYWHAAEEIEHRDVAFDVLQAVHPSYALRVAGLAMATACLGGFWVVATLMLLGQEKDLALPRLRRDWGVARERARQHGVFVKGLREYLRPGFHPSQKETDSLAAEYLASVGLS